MLIATLISARSPRPHIHYAACSAGGAGKRTRVRLHSATRGESNHEAFQEASARQIMGPGTGGPSAGEENQFPGVAEDFTFPEPGTEVQIAQEQDSPFAGRQGVVIGVHNATQLDVLQPIEVQFEQGQTGRFAVQEVHTVGQTDGQTNGTVTSTVKDWADNENPDTWADESPNARSSPQGPTQGPTQGPGPSAADPDRVGVEWLDDAPPNLVVGADQDGVLTAGESADKLTTGNGVAAVRTAPINMALRGSLKGPVRGPLLPGRSLAAPINRRCLPYAETRRATVKAFSTDQEGSKQGPSEGPVGPAGKVDPAKTTVDLTASIDALDGLLDGTDRRTGEMDGQTDIPPMHKPHKPDEHGSAENTVKVPSMVKPHKPTSTIDEEEVEKDVPLRKAKFEAQREELMRREDSVHRSWDAAHAKEQVDPVVKGAVNKLLNAKAPNNRPGEAVVTPAIILITALFAVFETGYIIYDLTKEAIIGRENPHLSKNVDNITLALLFTLLIIWQL